MVSSVVQIFLFIFISTIIFVTIDGMSFEIRKNYEYYNRDVLSWDHQYERFLEQVQNELGGLNTTLINKEENYEQYDETNISLKLDLSISNYESDEEENDTDQSNEEFSTSFSTSKQSKDIFTL